MNHFLQQVYFNNTIKQYLTVGIIILVVFLFKKYIAHYIGSALFQIAKLRWKKMDKESFLSLGVKPLGLFLATLITVVTLDKLTLPDELDFNIYHISFKEVLRMAGSLFIIGTFFLYLLKCIDFIMLMIRSRYLQEAKDASQHQLLFFFKDLIKVIVGIIGILLILKYTFDYDIKSLLTGLSIVGAAVALALKESLENLIASFIIFFDKPFGTGDSVKLNNISGTVEKIGLRSTRIRSDNKTYITVPNKQMVDSILDNQTRRSQWYGDLKVELSASVSHKQVEGFITAVKKALANRDDLISYNVFLINFTHNSVVIQTDFNTPPIKYDHFRSIKQEISLLLIALLEEHEIMMAGAVSDIKIIKEND